MLRQLALAGHGSFIVLSQKDLYRLGSQHPGPPSYNHYMHSVSGPLHLSTSLQPRHTTHGMDVPDFGQTVLARNATGRFREGLAQELGSDPVAVLLREKGQVEKYHATSVIPRRGRQALLKAGDYVLGRRGDVFLPAVVVRTPFSLNATVDAPGDDAFRVQFYDQVPASLPAVDVEIIPFAVYTDTVEMIEDYMLQELLAASHINGGPTRRPNPQSSRSRTAFHSSMNRGSSSRPQWTERSARQRTSSVKTRWELQQDKERMAAEVEREQREQRVLLDRERARQLEPSKRMQRMVRDAEARLEQSRRDHQADAAARRRAELAAQQQDTEAARHQSARAQQGIALASLRREQTMRRRYEREQERDKTLKKEQVVEVKRQRDSERRQQQLQQAAEQQAAEQAALLQLQAREQTRRQKTAEERRADAEAQVLADRIRQEKHAATHDHVEDLKTQTTAMMQARMEHKTQKQLELRTKDAERKANLLRQEQQKIAKEQAARHQRQQTAASAQEAAAKASERAADPKVRQTNARLQREAERERGNFAKQAEALRVKQAQVFFLFFKQPITGKSRRISTNTSSFFHAGAGPAAAAPYPRTARAAYSQDPRLGATPAAACTSPWRASPSDSRRRTGAGGRQAGSTPRRAR
eukprot:m.204179 g.204179  ORF g.204179 m.204179 type:complete len:642 (+) comp21994_c0_seq3:248-2173(+)